MFFFVCLLRFLMHNLQYCEQRNGYLAEIKDYSQQSNVNLLDASGSWIGLGDKCKEGKIDIFFKNQFKFKCFQNGVLFKLFSNSFFNRHCIKKKLYYFVICCRRMEVGSYWCSSNLYQLGLRLRKRDANQSFSTRVATKVLKDFDA